MVGKGLAAYAYRHIRNEPKDWMNDLTWDGVSRVQSFFHTCMGAKKDEYNMAISKNWWISMVARVFSPGCKVDNMVIFEGGQGLGKSTALDAIGGKWYVEANENINSKDFYQLLHGKLVIEFSELDAFNKSDTNTIKKVVSCRTDRFRAPYGRAPADWPRQCVFIGTTNETNYLTDSTGARRFWPISVNNIKINKIKRDREQLFAEAVHRYKNGETWYEVPDSAAVEQERRRDMDEWEPLISAWLHQKLTTNVMSVAREALGIGADRMERRHQLRIAKALRAVGWKKGLSKRDSSGRVVIPWYPGSHDESDDLEGEQVSLKNHAPGGTDTIIYLN